MDNRDYFLIVALIGIGVLTRTVFHLGANVEFVTGAALVAGYFLSSKKLALVVPLVTMFVSDLIIGNTSIYLFTWSAYLLTPLLGVLLARSGLADKGYNIKSVLALQGTGLLSVVIFFLWTNLGVVITTNMYPNTLSGLMQSYINALPFLRPQLVSVFITLPIMFVAGWLVMRYSKTESLNIRESL